MKGERKRERYFFPPCHERGTKKKFWVSMRNRTSHLRIPRFDALITEPQGLHSERGLLRSSHISLPLFCCGLNKEQRFKKNASFCFVFQVTYITLPPVLVCPTSELIRVALPVFGGKKNSHHAFQSLKLSNKWSHTLFNTHRKRICQARLTSSLAYYSAGNTHVK